jgi:hypothetical protein
MHSCFQSDPSTTLVVEPQVRAFQSAKIAAPTNGRAASRKLLAQPKARRAGIRIQERLAYQAAVRGANVCASWRRSGWNEGLTALLLGNHVGQSVQRGLPGRAIMHPIQPNAIT